MEVKTSIKFTSTHSKELRGGLAIGLTLHYPLRPPFDRLLPLIDLAFDPDMDHGDVGNLRSPCMQPSATNLLRRAPETAAMAADGGLWFFGCVVSRT